MHLNINQNINISLIFVRKKMGYVKWEWEWGKNEFSINGKLFGHSFWQLLAAESKGFPLRSKFVYQSETGEGNSSKFS